MSSTLRASGSGRRRRSPERLARWWGKRGWSTPPSSITLDVRPGGVFRLNSISDEDGSEMPLDTVYRDVVEPERLTFGDATSRSTTSATAERR